MAKLKGYDNPLPSISALVDASKSFTNPKPETSIKGHRYFNQQNGLRKRLSEDSVVSSNSHGSPAKPLELELMFKDLNITLDKTQILHDVSGIAKPGEMLAVMGPSGSGKTTLLNALAARSPIDSGEVTLNGCKINKRLKRKICYVLQQDIFFANLTLRETLIYTALLRLPDAMPRKEKIRRVHEIADVLGITKCLDTIMGNAMTRGLSGGEKKRANIASELLTNPMLMLLDEPTSGLDSHTAYSLMQTLKQYTERSRKTVVATIHQPSSQIYHMFDRVLLMCNGHVAYFGDAKKILDFFSSIGLQCYPNYNPADFILEKVKDEEPIQRRIIEAADKMRESDQWPVELQHSKRKLSLNGDVPVETEPLLGPDNNDLTNIITTNGGLKSVEVESHDGVKKTRINKQDMNEIQIELDDLEESDPYTVDPTQRWPTSWLTQYTVLTMRNFKQSRARLWSKLNFAQMISLSLVVGLLWFQLPRTEETIFDRMGVLFFSVTYFGFWPMFDALTSFPDERVVINKERASGAYRLSAYYVAKMTSELPLVLIIPSAYFIVVYVMTGLSGVGPFFASWGILMISVTAAQSYGLFVGAACMDLKTGITVISLTMLSSMLTGGFYVRHVPAWFSWTKYLSIINYSFHGLMIIEFTNSDPIRCTFTNLTQPSEGVYPECLGGLANETQYFPAERVLEVYHVTWPLYGLILMTLLFAVIFRTMGYITLRYFRKPH